MQITIPYKFIPRQYQLPVLDALDSGIKRGVCVWHRRAGKDKTGLNYMIKRMWQKKGIYYYFMPTYSQGKKIIWDGIDKSGMRFLDHFPRDLIAGKPNESEMKIRFKNSSLFQIIGTDNIDAIVGTNPVGAVFSEYALQNPQAWDFIRPILRENGGWALFLYTPRGHNHGYELYNMAQLNSDWFCELLTVDNTKRPDGSPVITPEDVEKERKEGMDEDLIQQEYYCSFEGAMSGSYYGRYLQRAIKEGRVTDVPYDYNLKVNTAWDLGIGDSMAIWFFQVHGDTFRLIDYYESSGESLVHYVKVMQDRKYLYDRHYAPHDIKVRELTTGKSRLETARKLGINFQVVPNFPLEEGIDAARRIFNRCWFDKNKCKQGIDALMNYHKEYDEKRQEFKQHPVHDWSSHAADAIRMLALGVKDLLLNPQGNKRAYEDRVDIQEEKREQEPQFDPINPFGEL